MAVVDLINWFCRFNISFPLLWLGHNSATLWLYTNFTAHCLFFFFFLFFLRIYCPLSIVTIKEEAKKTVPHCPILEARIKIRWYLIYLPSFCVLFFDSLIIFYQPRLNYSTVTKIYDSMFIRYAYASSSPKLSIISNLSKHEAQPQRPGQALPWGKLSDIWSSPSVSHHLMPMGHA